jgi:hypothetical protein
MKHGFVGWKTAAFALLMGLGVAGNATAQARPAVIRDVDRPTAQPVSGHCMADSPANHPGMAKCVLYTVPAGKRLVVETVSFGLVTAAAEDVSEVVFGKNHTEVVNILFAAGAYAVSPGTPFISTTTKRYSGSQQLRFYLEEDEGLAGQVYYTGGPSYMQDFGFSGYLVDK